MNMLDILRNMKSFGITAAQLDASLRRAAPILRDGSRVGAVPTSTVVKKK